MKNFIHVVGFGLFFLTFLLIGSIWLLPKLKKNSAKGVVERLYEYEETHGNFPPLLRQIGISDTQYIYAASGDCMEEFVLAYMNGLTLIGYSSEEEEWWRD